MPATADRISPNSRTPVAYLRRSSASSSGRAGQISFDVQSRAVGELAARHGDAEPELLVEWGVSGAARASAFGGTGRGGRRRTFAELRERIEAGRVSAIYAYSLSRLARSTRDMLELAELCAKAGVPVRLAKEGELDFRTPHGRLYLTVLAAVATFEAEVSAERAQDRTDAARANDEYIGRPPFGWRIVEGRLVEEPGEQAILGRARQALASTPSYRQAARQLNEAGVPSPMGGRWREGTMRRFADRAAGRSLVRDRTVKGSPRVATARFSRLLRCAVCNGKLTPARKRYGTAAGETREMVAYECHTARYDPRHAYPRSIAETTVLAWAMEHVRIRDLDERVAIAQADEAKVAELDRRRRNLVAAVEDGLLAASDVAARRTAIEAELAALAERTVFADVPAEIDWTAPVEHVQAAVAAVIDEIVVDMAGPTFRPSWRDERYRAGAEDPAVEVA
jgi:DNA invertase Pin-like site-specific DNA recombinase